jgi:peptide/nickel transport system ATP-binding protein
LSNAHEDRFDVKIEGLSVAYRTNRGLLVAVRGIDLNLEKGKIWALVGESGCGKSTLGLSLPRLLPEDQVEYSGNIIYNGQNILTLKERQLEDIRGSVFASIFQEPMTSLNPVYRIGEQIAEALLIKSKRGRGYETLEDRVPKPSLTQHVLGSGASSLRRYHGRLLELYPEVYSLLEEVWIPNPKRVAEMYPHELSGGMKQRVMIAIALAGRPSFLIADEPTTALDLTIQTQILTLIKKINKDYGMGVLLITHDLGVVSAVSDYAIVMYAGKIVEQGSTKKLIESPQHPYTQGLIASFPKGRKDEQGTLTTIPGAVPPLGRYPEGCSFHPRCPMAFAKCPTAIPRLTEVSSDHKVACFLYGGS